MFIIIVSLHQSGSGMFGCKEDERKWSSLLQLCVPQLHPPADTFTLTQHATVE